MQGLEVAVARTYRIHREIRLQLLETVLSSVQRHVAKVMETQRDGEIATRLSFRVPVNDSTSTQCAIHGKRRQLCGRYELMAYDAALCLRSRSTSPATVAPHDGIVGQNLSVAEKPRC